MNEILKNEAKIRELLRLRNGRSMTDSEFREQGESCVVGNAFDVFSDTEVVSRKLLNEIRQQRLQVAS